MLTETGELIAALFYAGHGSALSHRSAAHWWGLIERRPERIHVSVVRRTRPTRGISLHHPRALQRVFWNDLPITPVPRTLVDLAVTATLKEMRKALAEADYQRRYDQEAILEAAGRGRPGSRVLKRALALHLPQLATTENDLEKEFIFICQRHGLPIPEPNVRIGPYRVDALFRDLRVVVELDGRAAHESEARKLTDHRRDLYLRRLGYTVRRYSWFQVFRAPRELATDLRATLATANAAQTSR